MKRLDLKKGVYSLLDLPFYNFRIAKGQRPVNKKKVAKYVEMYKSGVDLHHITVSEDGFIVDGQHRFEALRTLLFEGFNLPNIDVVVLSVSEDEIPQFAMEMNSAGNWTANDKLEAKISAGNTNAEKVKQFCYDYNVLKSDVPMVTYALCLIFGEHIIDKCNFTALTDNDIEVGRKAKELYDKVNRIIYDYDPCINLTTGRIGCLKACRRFVKKYPDNYLKKVKRVKAEIFRAFSTSTQSPEAWLNQIEQM